MVLRRPLPRQGARRRNVAVLEKGWIGSGNAGRNTTIIRSNYLLPGNIPSTNGR
jgi:glycine/D-amino acid oxidase-like deaminating enzyme